MIRTKNTQIFLLALAAAWLLASTQIQRPDNWPLAGLYIYWTVRILLEAGLFVAFLELFGRLPALKDQVRLTAAIAALVSLVPFALAVTALDLILGLPELGELVSSGASGTASSTTTGETHIGSFLLELIYLSDNHLVLCLLLSVPLLFQSVSPAAKIENRNEPNERSGLSVTSTDDVVPLADPFSSDPQPEKGYQRHLEIPLQGSVLRVEAQEHYVRLITALETRMVLYRFNDIVSELSANEGMQVHRSHWVAFEAMERLLREHGRMWLELTDGTKVPVSRKYTDDVRRAIDLQGNETKKAVN